MNETIWINKRNLKLLINELIVLLNDGKVYGVSVHTEKGTEIIIKMIR